MRYLSLRASLTALAVGRSSKAAAVSAVRRPTSLSHTTPSTAAAPPTTPRRSSHVATSSGVSKGGAVPATTSSTSTWASGDAPSCAAAWSRIFCATCGLHMFTTRSPCTAHVSRTVVEAPKSSKGSTKISVVGVVVVGSSTPPPRSVRSQRFNHPPPVASSGMQQDRRRRYARIFCATGERRNGRQNIGPTFQRLARISPSTSPDRRSLATARRESKSSKSREGGHQASLAIVLVHVIASPRIFVHSTFFKRCPAMCPSRRPPTPPTTTERWTWTRAW